VVDLGKPTVIATNLKAIHNFPTNWFEPDNFIESTQMAYRKSVNKPRQDAPSFICKSPSRGNLRTAT